MNVDAFRQLPLMGILRGGEVDTIEPLVEAVAAAGLETLEVAMNTPDATGLIRRAVEVSAGRLTIGAGTVLTTDLLLSALEAGATFIVLPTLVAEVVARCRDRGVPVFPGALTPREIFDAWCAGATMVKVFPAGAFGPDYLREIKGPFGEVELLACGGVRLDNMGAFFASGASAVAFGASVFQEERLATGEFSLIEAELRALVRAFGRLSRAAGQ
ncbi:MAG: bifunctional 4-hydroxy-2-oxoglutarate aldolase/2-dehydro-3-deoxy-phosphogluconate aldolase [Candidatus Binatia bacterium]